MIEDIEQMINRIAHEAVEGHQSALSAYIDLKSIESYLKDSIASIKTAALDEADKYDGQEFKGNIVRTVEGRKSYDYKHYDGWKAKKKELKSIEEKMKAGANNNAEMLDENGEIIPPAKIKIGTPYIRLEKADV